MLLSASDILPTLYYKKKTKTFIRFQHCNLIFHFLHEKVSVDLLKLDLTALGNKPHNLCSHSTEVYCFMLNFNTSKLVCYRWFLCHKAAKTTRAFAFRLKCYFILKRHFSASRVFPVSFLYITLIRMESSTWWYEIVKLVLFWSFLYIQCNGMCATNLGIFLW